MQNVFATPPELDAFLRKARELFGRKQFCEALSGALAILQQFPRSHEAFEVAAASAQALGNFPLAENLWQKAVELDPQNARKHFRLASLYIATGHLIKAEHHFRIALTLNPDFEDAHNNFGVFLMQQDRFAEAEHHYREALRIKPHSPGFLNNLGALMRSQRRYHEAEACYVDTLKLNPEFIQAYNNLGCLYADQNYFDRADACFQHALTLKPHSPEARYLYSVAVLLRNGRFKEGWSFYEARYDPLKQEPISIKPNVPFPQWKGESLQGKSLVIYEEQGFGDAIQFVRYAKVLKGEGASRITFICRRPLQSLFQTAEGIDAFLTPEDPVPAHDFWTLCMSIPLHTNFRIDAIPYAQGFLQASNQDDPRWKDIVRSQRMKVGLIWKGSPGHKNDSERSIRDPTLFKKLWEIPGIDFFSLQSETLADYENGPFALDTHIKPLGHLIETFADTAAVIASLDLLISVDTAPAHVAGALGKPVWTLLASPSDWRWLHEREDTPWYSSMKLFHQEKQGDWESLIEKVRDKLALLTPK